MAEMSDAEKLLDAYRDAALDRDCTQGWLCEEADTPRYKAVMDEKIAAELKARNAILEHLAVKDREIARYRDGIRKAAHSGHYGECCFNDGKDVELCTPETCIWTELLANSPADSQPGTSPRS